jgi:dTMP kinase
VTVQVTANGRGRLIALEGIDGCGKSTQAQLLSARLGALLTFEPGATRLGASLRHLLLDRDQPVVDDRSEALLMAADRAQHLAEVVEPALASGTWVVTDRFSASTLAYQGYGRGLDRTELDGLVRWATGGLSPDLNVLIDISVESAGRRRHGADHDRLEEEGEAFLTRVADGYHRLVGQGGEAWLVVDGSGPVDEVAAAVWSGVRDRIGTGAAPDHA